MLRERRKSKTSTKGTDSTAIVNTIAPIGTGPNNIANPACKPGGRLVDKVVGAGPCFVATTTGGKRRLRNVGKLAAEIRAASTRFVLESDVSGWCIDTVREDFGLLNPANPFLRMPTDCFWIEWPEPIKWPDREHSRSLRVGALVKSSPDGRSGEITGYIESQDGGAAMSILTVHFDLDKSLIKTADGARNFALRNADLPHLDALFENTVAVIDPLWAQYVAERWGARGKEQVAAANDWVWGLLPRILSFSVLLQSDIPTQQTAVGLERFKQDSRRRGQAALLDHIEVKLDLGSDRVNVDGARVSGGRAFPRLHPVRGHLVTRHGKTFWRAAHLRGDERRAIVTRTTTVVGLPTKRSVRVDGFPRSPPS